MRKFGLGMTVALLVGLCGPLAAQSVVQKTAIVTLDQEKLFVGTKYGVALQARFEAESAALVAENRKIDSALEAEERDLTDKRATMDAASFRPLAEAFDKKANELRAAQDVKARDLTLRRDQNRRPSFKTLRRYWAIIW